MTLEEFAARYGFTKENGCFSEEAVGALLVADGGFYLHLMQNDDGSVFAEGDDLESRFDSVGELCEYVEHHWDWKDLIVTQ